MKAVVSIAQSIAARRFTLIDFAGAYYLGSFVTEESWKAAFITVLLVGAISVALTKFVRSRTDEDEG